MLRAATASGSQSGIGRLAAAENAGVFAAVERVRAKAPPDLCLRLRRQGVRCAVPRSRGGWPHDGPWRRMIARATGTISSSWPAIGSAAHAEAGQVDAWARKAAGPRMLRSRIAVRGAARTLGADG